jgi:hypothetical protein
MRQGTNDIKIDRVMEQCKEEILNMNLELSYHAVFDCSACDGARSPKNHL